MLKCSPKILALLLLLGSCGFSPNSPSHLNITNGRPVAEDSPAKNTVVALATKEKDSYRSFCSGTLIASNLVLTASHCFMGMNGKDLYVVFGENVYEKAESVIKVIETQMYKKEGAKFFPNFDIAWVKLEKDAPAPYTPIEILRSPTALTKHQKVIYAGYGKINTDCKKSDPTCSGHRLEVESNFSEYIDTPRFQSLIVTVNEGKGGTCSGDSGGPLYAQVKGQWYVVGDLNGKNRFLTPNIFKQPSKQYCEVGEAIYNFAGDYVDWIEASSHVKLLQRESNPSIAKAETKPLSTRPTALEYLSYKNSGNPEWYTIQYLAEKSAAALHQGDIDALRSLIENPILLLSYLREKTTLSHEGKTFDLGTLSYSDLAFGSVSSFSTLMPNLEEIDLDKENLSTLQGFSGLSKLKKLALGGNESWYGIKQQLDLSEIDHLQALESLSLKNMDFSTDISKFPSPENTLPITSLTLTNIENFEPALFPLSKFGNLKELTITNSNLTSLDFLIHFPKLEVLTLRKNNIKNISILNTLPQLKQFKSFLNPIDNKVCPMGKECDFGPDLPHTFFEACRFIGKFQLDDLPVLPIMREFLALTRSLSMEVTSYTKNSMAKCLILESTFRNTTELNLAHYGTNSFVILGQMRGLQKLSLELTNPQSPDLTPLQNLNELTELKIISPNSLDLSFISNRPSLKTVIEKRITP